MKAIKGATGPRKHALNPFHGPVMVPISRNVGSLTGPAKLTLTQIIDASGAQ